jgi:hypothetical protein
VVSKVEVVKEDVGVLIKNMDSEDLSEFLYEIETESLEVANLILKSKIVNYFYLSILESEIMKYNIDTLAKAIICFVR